MEFLVVFLMLMTLHKDTLGFGESVCYDQLGCFNNSYPWNMHYRILTPLPASPEDVGTTFYWFSESDANPISITTWPDISFEGTSFNSTRQTYFITHGFRDAILGSWGENMSRAIATKDSFNVLAVDWSRGAGGLDYWAATSNTRTVGAEMSRVINYMISTLNVSRTDIHLIGHSLGAHVCAYASNGAGGIYEITGLDSAQPLFEGYNEIVYLDKTDACVVYGLHTDAKPFLPFLGLGFIEPYGDIDDYANGGIHQPGCAEVSPVSDDSTLDIILNIPEIVENLITCPHSRAHVYYLETITNTSCIMWGHHDEQVDPFVSTLVNGNITLFPEITNDCNLESCIPIDLNATEYPARGSFISRTNDELPFCIFEPTTNSIMAEFIKSYRDPQKYEVCAAKGIQVE